MLRKSFILILVALLILVGELAAQVTSIKLNVNPETAKIRPLETAVITAEFYGVNKKGIWGNIFGGASDKAKDKLIKSNNWKASITNSSAGSFSKPFLFQEAGEKTKAGIENFIKQTLGAASAKDSILYTAPSKPGKYKIKITDGEISKEITITVSSSARSSRVKEISNFINQSKSNDKYFYLVEHYAPFIAQETWFNPKADYLVRFDYDENWKGDDNWKNLAEGSSQAFVYYAVMETKTHWFVQYNFFHARDYSDVCIAGTCHENDNEGLILTVRKDESKFGELEVMETLAHNNIYSFTNDSSIKKGVHRIDGDIALYKNVRPIVFIEAGGHGVFGGKYKPSLFSIEAMDFKQNTGVTYIYKAKAERPKHANDRNIGYSLLPISSEWWSKGHKETDVSTDTFDNFYSYQPYGNRPKANAKFIAGAFKGRIAGDNKAKPFWAWHDRRTKRKRVLNTGQWALDPAYSVSKNLKFPKGRKVSTEYIFNPYLEIGKSNLP